MFSFPLLSQPDDAAAMRRATKGDWKPKEPDWVPREVFLVWFEIL